MRLSGSTRAAAFAVSLAAFVGSMTGVAWAPKNLSVHVIEAPCDVKDVGSGSFLGSVTLTGFTLVNGQVSGVASVSGSCMLASRKVLVSGSAIVPVTVLDLSCAELDLLLGDVSVGGTTIRTAGTSLGIFPGSRGSEA